MATGYWPQIRVIRSHKAPEMLRKMGYWDKIYYRRMDIYIGYQGTSVFLGGGSKIWNVNELEPIICPSIHFTDLGLL